MEVDHLGTVLDSSPMHPIYPMEPAVSSLDLMIFVVDLFTKTRQDERRLQEFGSLILSFLVPPKLLLKGNHQVSSSFERTALHRFPKT